ncbi:MAG: DNA polymerase III subunit delta' [Patescibacteria group bacterium]
MTKQAPWQINNPVGRYLSQLIDNDSLSHAYLIYGQSGVGKVDVVEFFLQKLFCLSATDKPCAKCSACQQVKSRHLPDVYWIAKANGRQDILIQQIRDLWAFVKNRSYSGGWRAVVINLADDMNAEAANALLKILEEPAERVIFILVAVNWRKIPRTIVSRCQLLPLGLMPLDELAKLIEAAGAERQSAVELAALAGGRVSRALNWLNNNSEPAVRVQLAGKLMAAARQNSWSDWQLLINDYLIKPGDSLSPAQLSQDLLVVAQEVGQDILRTKLGLGQFITYQKYQSELKLLADSWSYQLLKFWFEQLATAQTKIMANGNVKLTLECMIANIIDYE